VSAQNSGLLDQLHISDRGTQNLLTNSARSWRQSFCRLRLLIGCLVSCAVPSGGLAQGNAAVAVDADDIALAHAVDTWAQAIVASGEVPGMAVALVHGSTVVLAQGYGVRSVGRPEPVDLDTVFRLASVSKTFASSLLTVLQEQHFVSLDTPVHDLVPGLRLKVPELTAQLSLEDMLSHRAGLPYHTLDTVLEASQSFQPVRDKLASVKPACALGACFAYQNVLFDYASDAVLALTGMGYAQALNRELLAPLHMTRTTVGREAYLAEPNRAAPHVRTAHGIQAVIPKPNYYWMPAAAGMNASLRDLMRWNLAQLGLQPEVLSSQVLSELHRARIDTPGEIIAPAWRRTRVRSASYALGFRRFDYSGNILIFHAGAVEGFRAVFALHPDSQRGVIVLWNSGSGLPGGMLPQIYDRWFQLPQVDWLQLPNALAPTRARGPLAKP